jgi:alcohol dehydrogenase class IV
MFETNMIQFYFPVKIISGTNATSALGDEVKGLGCSRPLLITDKGIVSAGLLKKATDILDDSGISFSIFDMVEPDPHTKIVEAAAHSAEKTKSDIIIAVGGGSSIDTAKGASILATNKGNIADYEGIIPAYKIPPLPIITIPTTAGSGSEISSAAIITDEERHFKMVIKSGSGQIFAKTSILDPMNLIGIPPRIAAETGIDALSHAIEAAISLRRTFVTDSFSLNAIRIIFRNLRGFVANTSDVFSALNMLNASCLAGIAMTTGGLGLVHAMAHPLGAYGKISHGLACGLLLPHVLEHNLISSIERYGDMAIAANPDSAADSMGDRDMAFRMIDEVNDLLEDLQFPETVGDMGISLELTDKIVDDAYNSYLAQINPRSTSREEVVKMFERVL